MIGKKLIAPVVITLTVLGVLSGIARTSYPTTLGERAEKIRASAWRAFDLQEPFPAERAQRVREVEARFADSPIWIVLHAAIGSLFLIAAALQFVRGIRTRHLNVHRWNGRVLIGAGLVIAATGIYFGVFIPAAGPREAVIIALASFFFIVSLVSGAIAIRRRNVRAHREWMIRAFAAAIGISTVRIVAAIADATLTPRGWSLDNLFILSLAVGWGITIAVAELWIIGTRENTWSIVRSIQNGN